jgi:hypothetical protein
LWFYQTARTHSNFYESCELRNAIVPLAAKLSLTAAEKGAARIKLAAWKTILEDELANTREARPLVQQDMRLDCYYGGDHTFPHGEKMIRAKLTILQSEINEYLPSLGKKFAD